MVCTRVAMVATTGCICQPSGPTPSRVIFMGWPCVQGQPRRSMPPHRLALPPARMRERTEKNKKKGGGPPPPGGHHQPARARPLPPPPPPPEFKGGFFP